MVPEQVAQELVQAVQVLPVVIDPGGQVVQQVLLKRYGAMNKQLVHVVGLPEQASQGEEQSIEYKSRQFF